VLPDTHSKQGTPGASRFVPHSFAPEVGARTDLVAIFLPTREGSSDHIQIIAPPLVIPS